MSATLMPNGKHRFYNLDGSVLAGGKLYTYAAGTVVPKATYVDQNATTPNTNPVVLDIRGEALVRWDGSYKYVLTTATGTVIETIDDFTPASLLLGGSTGAGLLGFLYTAIYGAGTIGKWLQDLALAAGSSFIGHIGAGVGAVLRKVQDVLRDHPSVFGFMTAAQIADVRSGAPVLDHTAAIQNAINYGGRMLMNAGSYRITSLDFKGKSVDLYGEGEDKTIVTGISAALMFDVQEVADKPLLPLGIRNMRLNGGSTATGGIFTRYRHKTDLSNVTITNINGDALNELDAWNNRRRNLTLNNNVNGLVCAGANNNCAYDGLSISGNTQYGVKVMPGGTVPGGSTALSFNQCDIEFASGLGVYHGSHGVTEFNDCYIGEQIQGSVFDMAAGMVVMRGGFAYFGTLIGSYLGYMTAGKLILKNVNVSGGSFATASNMFFAGNGRATVEDSPCLITVTGTQVMSGDTLDYGRSYQCFAPTLGRKYSSFTLNGTNSTTTVDNELKVTCLTVTGAPCIMEVNAPVDNKWLRNKPGSLVVVYKSTKDLVARLTNGSVGITPDIDIGTLPSTGGVVKTAVLFDWVYFSNDGGSQDMTLLEIFQANTIVGDNFTIYEVFLSDFKNGKADAQATFYNLSKT